MKKKDRKLSKRLKTAGLGKKWFSKKWVTETKETTGDIKKIGFNHESHGFWTKRFANEAEYNDAVKAF